MHSCHHTRPPTSEASPGALARADDTHVQGTIVRGLLASEGRRPRRPRQLVGLFRKAWLRGLPGGGIPGRLFHDLRRTAVRNLEPAGFPRSAAMADGRLQNREHLPSLCDRRHGAAEDRRERLGQVPGYPYALEDRLTAFGLWSGAGQGQVEEPFRRIRNRPLASVQRAGSTTIHLVMAELVRATAEAGCTDVSRFRARQRADPRQTSAVCQ